MANPEETVSLVAPVEAPVVETPVVETPVAAPAVVETVAETPTPVEPVVTASEAEAPAVEATTEAPKVEETKEESKALLSEEPKVETTETEVKVEETETKEGGQSDEPAPPPSYEAFKVPEEIPLDEGRVSEFTSILAELELEGKADHAVVQQVGQKMVDFHINELKLQAESVVSQIQTQQLEAWETQLNTWKDQTVNHPEIGGPRLQATIEAANQFIKTHGGTAEQQKEIRSVLNTSGLGNHPVIVELFAKAGKAMSEGIPLAATSPVSAPKSRVSTMYGRDK